MDANASIKVSKNPNPNLSSVVSFALKYLQV